MAARFEVEVTVASAKNLKNVNWRHGDLLPYAALWVDSGAKRTTKVAVDGDDDDPVWDEKLVISIDGYERRSDLNDAVLHVDIVHANPESDVKPLVGSGKLTLGEVVDEVGLGAKAIRTLKLKRPSGRPHGKLELRVCVREKEAARYAQPAPYGVPYGQQQRDIYGQPYGYAQQGPPASYPYGAPPPGGYGYGAAPPSGYPYAPPSGYTYAPQPPAYGQGGSGSSYGYTAPPPPAYGQGGSGSSYGYAAPPPAAEKKSKFGMGTGLAVGAAAGVLGGLALAEGVDYVEDKIADEAAEKVEEDLGYDVYDDY